MHFSCFCSQKRACFREPQRINLSFFTLFVTVDERVIARWTNNLYYAGKISSIEGDQLHVLFDEGDRITHSFMDISAVIPDLSPSQVEIGEHVFATGKGGHKYFIGYVTDEGSFGRFKVTFDDNDEDVYDANELRIFPEHFSAHSGK